MPKFKRLNQRQEVFAQGIAAGLSGVEAFKRVTPGNQRDCDVKAAQMRRKPGVEGRIAELLAQNARKSEMTRAELMAFYATVIRTPADQVPPGSPVIQAYEETPEGGRKIRIVDKAAAGQALARMCGWNEPEQVNLGLANTLTTYLAELRAQRIGDGMFTVAGERTAPVIELGKSQANSIDHQGASE
jgi:hypothetical protein